MIINVAYIVHENVVHIVYIVHIVYMFRKRHLIR